MIMPSIDLKGTIVSDDDKWLYDFVGLDAVCPADIRKGLAFYQNTAKLWQQDHV